MPDWTQPVCYNRFKEIYPDKEPVPMKDILPPDPCCFCGHPTRIYIRIDPATVPFPREV
jgi:hypothetical protein